MVSSPTFTEHQTSTTHTMEDNPETYITDNRPTVVLDVSSITVNDQKNIWNAIGADSQTFQHSQSTLVMKIVHLMENRILYAMNGRELRIKKMMEILTDIYKKNDPSKEPLPSEDWSDLFNHSVITDQSVLQLYSFDIQMVKDKPLLHPSNSATCSQLPKQARQELVDLVTTIASKYNHVYYHNFTHAIHVTESAATLMDFLILETHRNHQPQTANEASFQGSPYNIILDHVVPMAVCFAALVHDIEHQGVTNAQLIQEGFPLARKLKIGSVAESNSLVLALDILREERFRNLKECMFGRIEPPFQPSDQLKFPRILEQCQRFIAYNDERRYRQCVISLILSTDIFSQDRQRICKQKWTQSFDRQADIINDAVVRETYPSDLSYFETFSQSLFGNGIPPMEGSSIFDQDSLDQVRATSILDHVIQVADVAPLFQDWNVFLFWGRNLYNEFWAAYLLGRGPNVTQNWYQGQISFFDTYILPLAQRIEKSGLFGEFGNTFYVNAMTLRSKWLEEGPSCCQSLQEDARSSIGAYERIDFILPHQTKVHLQSSMGRSIAFAVM